MKPGRTSALDLRTSAEQGYRAIALLPTDYTGYRFQDGSSRRPEALARCFACSVPFPGETAQEELDRRRVKRAAL